MCFSCGIISFLQWCPKWTIQKRFYIVFLCDEIVCNQVDKNMRKKKFKKLEKKKHKRKSKNNSEKNERFVPKQLY